MSVRFLNTRKPSHNQNIDERWVDLYVDKERRQYERHPIKLNVKISTVSDDGEPFSATTTTEDISLGGLCFATDRFDRLDGPIEIAVATAGSSQALLPPEFSGIGTVVRSHFEPDGRVTVGVTLGEGLRHNAEFAMFIAAASIQK
ncbi:MAG: PilZ domain-containing protein [Candidatus Hydrogenedentes bacterium]|nr:PilZ domain-containing protein [Candidatus Hydrogenedentota bacterium]